MEANTESVYTTGAFHAVVLTAFTSVASSSRRVAVTLRMRMDILLSFRNLGKSGLRVSCLGLGECPIVLLVN